MKLIIVMFRVNGLGTDPTIDRSMTVKVDVEHNSGMFFTPEPGWVISSVELKDEHETQ